jgi:hypothetical protein
VAVDGLSDAQEVVGVAPKFDAAGVRQVIEEILHQAEGTETDL